MHKISVLIKMKQTMNKPYMIAVAGGSGSGKSTIVRMIQEKCDPSKILVFHQDHYYKDLSHLTPKERDDVNYDHPDSIDEELLLSHIRQLSEGKSILRPTWDFVTHTRASDTVKVEPRPVIFFDGIFSLRYKQIHDLFELKLFVEIDGDLRFIRRLKRDIIERGRNLDGVIKQYETTVRPMHIQYIEPTKKDANLVIYWDKRSENTIELLTEIVQKKIVSP